MAIILKANYSKKAGLPSLSSHQFGLTIKVEIADAAQVQAEAARLYALLQSAVDQSLQQTGWFPPVCPDCVVNGQDNHGNGNTIGWSCTERQCRRILKIMDQLRWDMGQMEKLAQQSFGRGLRQLNKPEASRLIQKLLQIKTVLEDHPEIRRTQAHPATALGTEAMEVSSAPDLHSAAGEGASRIPQMIQEVKSQS